MTSSAGPPQLPGFEYLSDLGSGGFADVYLYQQRRPERKVAVKVLRQATQSAADATRFENEINRMSQLADHPGILTIYEDGVAPDGRPYFTMEHCPNDHFGHIASANPLPIARALEVGIKIAGAVETAHAAGILHRDIKPANILLTAYGEPALTDFGIAGGRDADTGDESDGVTIAFAPSEVASGRQRGDERSDVYSLAATIYALLAGRAPFSTGKKVSKAELSNRVIQGSPPPIDRQDVPAELQAVLDRAMAVDSGNRYGSAAEFGRALQTVEAELNLPQTPLRVPGPSRGALDVSDDAGSDDDNTSYRAPARIDPSQRRGEPPRPRTTQPLPTAAPLTPPPQRHAVADSPRGPVAYHPPSPRSPASPPESIDEPTQLRRRDQTKPEPSPTPPEPDDANEPGPRTRMIAASAAAIFAVVVVVAVVLTRPDGSSQADGSVTSSTEQPDPDAFILVTQPSPPTDVAISNGDEPGVVTWSNPSPEDNDAYRIEVTDGPRRGESFTTEEERLAFDDALGEVCVRVFVIRGSRISEPSREACHP